MTGPEQEAPAFTPGRLHNMTAPFATVPKVW